MSVIVCRQVWCVVALLEITMIWAWSSTTVTLTRRRQGISTARVMRRTVQTDTFRRRQGRSYLHSLNGHSIDHMSGDGQSPKKNKEPLSSSASSSLPSLPANAHRVVLMRHAESAFNQANIFTGWCDIELTPRGIVEAAEAGQVFCSHGLAFSKCYTSVLTRAIVTAQRSLEAAGRAYTPLTYDWRLNERHYGALQGLSKERTAQRLGRQLVMEWRRSFYARPPLMTEQHPHYSIIHQDARYKHIPNVPLGESLQDCQNRVMDAWKDILADMQARDDDNDHNKSNHFLVVAHANTLRALVMHLDEIPADEIEGLNIPTAIPFYYDIDKTTGKVLAAASKDTTTIEAGQFRGRYIFDERKKRSFLERQRAANDPWLWALHDHQVAKSMLVGDDHQGDDSFEEEAQGLEGLEEEAKINTQLFSSTQAE